MTKSTINCIDCGVERLVPNACLKLVKRCKPCQKVFNRNAARNRYRESKGIPFDAPLKRIIKETPEVAPDAKSPDVVDPWGNQQSSAPKPSTPRAPKEEVRVAAALTKLFDMIDDDSTVDDW